MIPQKRHALYRHFSANNELLYVGISLSAINRLGQHRDHAHWFNEISRVDIEFFETREAAMKAERIAIQHECPKHNIRFREQAKKKQLNIEPEDEANNPRHNSQRHLVREVVFKPIYTVEDAADLLKIGPTQVKRLIDCNKLGHIVLEEFSKKTSIGTKIYRKIAITGWQMIDFIEALEGEKSHENKLQIY